MFAASKNPPDMPLRTGFNTSAAADDAKVVVDNNNNNDGSNSSSNSSSGSSTRSILLPDTYREIIMCVDASRRHLIEG